MITIEQLRDKCKNARLLPVLEKIVTATDGLTKPGEVKLARNELDDFMFETAKFHPHATTVIKSVLGLFFQKDDEDSNTAFARGTGLGTVNINTTRSIIKIF